MDGGADVRVAGEMPASELGPGEERLIVGGVRQVGHDPPDAEPARAQRNGCRIPVPYGCINPLMGQSLSAALARKEGKRHPRHRKTARQAVDAIAWRVPDSSQ